MLLVDARKQKSAPSILDIFDFGDVWPQQVRTAILVGKDTPEDVIFLGTVALQRRKQMRIVFDEEQALSWLNELPE